MTEQQTIDIARLPVMGEAAQQSYPTATLYVVATPIGNVTDITLRALHLLALADVVACEDTRKTGALLQRFGLSKQTIAAHMHNEREVEDKPNALGNGKLRIALTAPRGAIFRLRILTQDGEELRSGISSNGEELEFTLQEPRIFQDDSTTLIVEVSREPGSEPTAEPYVLTTSGQY